MKVMKKILTMLFVMMMVLGMGTAVSAEEGTSPADKGSITIDNAISGQTYSIYKIFELESFYDSDPTNETATKRYAYKVASEWSGFFSGSGAGLNYVDINDGYVTWKAAKNGATDVAEFAKKSLEYAKDSTNGITVTKTVDATSTTTTIFNDLALGYYLVDSSVGTLCNLTTTNKTVTIQDKNEVPVVEKKITNSTGGNPVDENTASIGDTVYFKTTITAKLGAQNYVLHDKMSNALELDTASIAIKLNSNTVAGTNYTLTTTGLADECVFEIAFNKDFCDTLKKDDKIEVAYSAKLKESAAANTAYENETWLKYGDNSETTHVKTTTKTFEVSVFKCTEDNSGLADVTFGLYSDSTCNTSIKLKKDTIRMASEIYYPDTTGDVSLKTVTSGKFTIRGLGEGTYYLKEIDAPKGYNKLTAPIEIKIANDGTITVTGAGATYTTTEITIVNKTGTILPSTGGMGTTIMYIVGAVLLIGSGVMLITKKNAK